jgi:essential nuclear protein 1
MINEEDQKAYDKFTLNEPKQSRTIADIIMEKLTQKKTEIETINIDDNESRVMEVHLDDRIVNMYKQIGEVLSKYRSGKLPKAFKILPTLTNWEHV